MAKSDFEISRRNALRMLGGTALAAGLGTAARAQTAGSGATPTLFMDGHVHITNRVYWEKADFWQPQPGNWDYGRARAAGINCIIDNLGTYGGWNYNYTPKIFLRLMETALTDCPDELWQTDLWPDEAPTAPTPHGGLHGSAPWFLGYHALTTLDYDLAGEFEPWAPPQPFDDNTYGFPNRRFTKPELLGYVDWCRDRVRQTLDGLTEEMAARPLPSAHRYHGMLFAVIVGSMPLHVVEHASQIRQFLTAAGVTVQPMSGDRGYTG